MLWNVDAALRQMAAVRQHHSAPRQVNTKLPKSGLQVIVGRAVASRSRECVASHSIVLIAQSLLFCRRYGRSGRRRRSNGRAGVHNDGTFDQVGRERIVRNVHWHWRPTLRVVKLPFAPQGNSRQSDRVDRRFVTLDADAQEVAVGIESHPLNASF